MQNKVVKPERTHWRDLRLNDLHREWGWDCPMVDIDFLVLEYTHCRTVAIVEYKHEKWQVADPTHSASFVTITNLANIAKLPFFLVRYSDDMAIWVVRPLNNYALQHVPSQQVMTQAQYVALLYKLRDQELPAEIAQRLPNKFFPLIDED